jgi:hypothetical protein
VVAAGRTRIRFRKSREKMIQSTSFVGTSAWHVHSGDVSLDFCWWRSCQGVGSPKARRLHPTRIGTLADRLLESGGWTGTLPAGPMLLCSHTAGHSIRLAHPAKGCPGSGNSECGADVEISSPAARGAGVRLSVTHTRHSSSSGRLCRAHSWDRQKTRARWTRPPSTPAAGCSFTLSHRFFSFEGVFCLLSSAFGYHGKIGGPSGRLAPRVTTANTLLGLTAVTTRCHWHGPLRQCVVTRVDACGSRSALARRSAESQ